MPLFGRHDGDLVRGETPMRCIMPYRMPGRYESIVLNDSTFFLEETRVRSLDLVRRIVESPPQRLGDPAGEPVFAPAPSASAPAATQPRGETRPDHAA